MNRACAAMVLLTAVFGIWPSPAGAQIEQVTIGIGGMTWMFCAIQAERAVRRLEGVANVRAVQSERKVYVELKPRTPFDPKAFRKAIEGAGQRVETFELVLCATIEAHDGRYYLQPAEVAQRFAVSGDDAAQTLQSLAGRQVCARGKLVATDPQLAVEIADLATLDQH